MPTCSLLQAGRGFLPFDTCRGLPRGLLHRFARHLQAALLQQRDRCGSSDEFDEVCPVSVF